MPTERRNKPQRRRCSHDRDVVPARCSGCCGDGYVCSLLGGGGAVRSLSQLGATQAHRRGNCSPVSEANGGGGHCTTEHAVLCQEGRGLKKKKSGGIIIHECSGFLLKSPIRADRKRMWGGWMDVPTLPRGTGSAAENRKVPVAQEPESVGRASLLLNQVFLAEDKS